MTEMNRRQFITSTLIGAGACAFGGLSYSNAQATAKTPTTKNMRIGYCFYNWDWDWNDDIDKLMRLTKETGYEGFECKPSRFGLTAEVMKEKCDRWNVNCAAIAMGNAPTKDEAVKYAIDYVHTAGGEIARCDVPKESTARWVEYAAERGIILAIHPHEGSDIETREDMLRYLDARPGMYGCPDTGNLLLCGSDPVRTILNLGERCRYIHLKDLDPAAIGCFAKDGSLYWELGTGVIDVKGVMDALEKVNYAGWVTVECNVRVKDYVKSARNMRKVLSDIGY